MSHSVASLLAAVTEWAVRRPEVMAVALIGSHAAGTAGPGSDIDLVVITGDPHSQLGGRNWLDEFGVVRSVTLERWGMVTSLRVGYEGGLEVEFGIAPPRWAWTEPVDGGTREVVRAGMRILYDPNGVLAALEDAVASSQ